MKAKVSLPPKYALELLTVYAWEQGSSMNDFSTAEGFRTVLDLVIKYRQLCIFWTVNYNFQDEPMRTFLLTQIQKKRCLCPRPTNPHSDSLPHYFFHDLDSSPQGLVHSQQETEGEAARRVMFQGEDPTSGVGGARQMGRGGGDAEAGVRQRVPALLSSFCHVEMYVR